ncbi:MAG: alpha/beta hydrolase [Ignavibacteria bacterium]|nr:alpha/beta hydrolase [Ignavibacteria bacterium]
MNKINTVLHGIRSEHLELINNSQDEPVIILPGMLGSPINYAPLALMLASFHVLIVSRRSAGHYSEMINDFSLQSQIDEVIEVLDHLGMRQVSLIAHSMAVPIAIGVASHAKSMVSRMVLIDYPAEYKQLSDSWLKNAIVNRPEIDSTILQLIKRDSADHSAWQELSTLRIPILVACGSESLFVKEAQLIRYNQVLPFAEFFIYSGSSHEPWINSDNFLPNLNKFLSGRGSDPNDQRNLS